MTTTLKTIFQKPVNRPIEGVIKADDEACLRLEIEEYVLTNEVEKSRGYIARAEGANQAKLDNKGSASPFEALA